MPQRFGQLLPGHPDPSKKSLPRTDPYAQTPESKLLNSCNFSDFWLLISVSCFNRSALATTRKSPGRFLSDSW